MRKALGDFAMPVRSPFDRKFGSTAVSVARGILSMGVVFILIACGEQNQALSPRPEPHEIVGADLARGRQLVGEYGCVACHAVPGVKGPNSIVGPSLKNMALRAYIGGVLPMTPDNLVQWLLDPPAFDPRTAMPNMGIKEEEARDIAAFLLTLH